MSCVRLPPTLTSHRTHAVLTVRGVCVAQSQEGEGMARNAGSSRQGSGKGGAQLANAKDADSAEEEEGVTTSEYNRWLYLEQNWESAEDTRHNQMEGSQFRKKRDEKHRERGQLRQSASIEQMKKAKECVDEVHKANLSQGKQIRESIKKWRTSFYS